MVSPAKPDWAESRSCPGSEGVRLRNLSKRFLATHALSQVDMDIAPGEVHGLVGGNGSGKSTLIKILAGVHRGEAGGTVQIGSASIDAHAITPAVSHAARVRVVHQDVGIFSTMSVAENLSLGSGYERGMAGRVKWRDVRRRTAELIERFDIPAGPSTPLNQLSLGAQAQVAIARALQDVDVTQGGLLILDEPTAALPTHDADRLLLSLRRYANAGLSILYVSHRLGEVMSTCDRVTILRDGIRQGTESVAELGEARLAELIVGHAIAAPARPTNADRSTGTTRPAVLSIRSLSAGPLQSINMKVAEGEIVGIAGLLGSGRTELLRAVFGDLKIRDGQVRIDGQPVRFRGPPDAVAARIAYVPEHRVADAAFLDLSVHTNMSIGVMRNYWRAFRLRHRASRAASTAQMRRFGVKSPSLMSPLATLSGGNQQKVIMGRWLRTAPRLLLLDEPTQGVDVAARQDLHALVREAVDDGAGAIVVASDIEELAELAHRVLVLRRGRIVAEVAGDDLTALRLTQVLQ